MLHHSYLVSALPRWQKNAWKQLLSLRKQWYLENRFFRRATPRTILNLGAAGVATTVAATATGGRRAVWREPVHQGLGHPSPKMTRTCTEPCTTSIKCFEINNLCTIYSGRNTFTWASARTARFPSTPTGVDGQYEHGNNMLSTGRKTAKFPGELASTTGSKGVLHRVHRHPTPVTDTPPQRSTPL